MSYRLEYRYSVYRVPANRHGLSEDRYVIAIEGGDNNLYESATGRRVRSWSVCMIGTKSQVLMQAVDFAADCEGGALQPHGRCCSPESYIRRIRHLVDGPDYLHWGDWYAKLWVDVNPTIAADSRVKELASHTEHKYGEDRRIVSFEPEQYPLYFALIDSYGIALPAWYFAEVHGMP